MRFSLPSKKKVFTWSLGVLGAIFIGAIGSGVWQSILGPAIHFSTRWILDVASLGLKSYKDSVYEQVAAGDQTRASLETLFVVTTLYGMLALGLVSTVYLYTASLKRRCRNLLERIARISVPAATEIVPRDPMQEAASIRGDVEAELRSLNRGRWLNHGWAFLMLLGVGAQFVLFARLTYADLAVNHYHQVLRVAAPYLDAHEQALVESQFAQLGSREDYVKVLSKLEDECKAHGQTVPKFDPW